MKFENKKTNENVMILWKCLTRIQMTGENLENRRHCVYLCMCVFEV